MFEMFTFYEKNLIFETKDAKNEYLNKEVEITNFILKNVR